MFVWMEYVAWKNGLLIKHKWNSNEERRIGSYVDGMDEANGHIYEVCDIPIITITISIMIAITI